MSADMLAKQSIAAPSTAPFSAGTAWVKPLADAPGRFFSEQLNFAARYRHAQAGFLQNIAKCKNPAEMFLDQTKAIQSAVEEFSSGATKAWRAAQDAAALA